MVDALPAMAAVARSVWRPAAQPLPDYLHMVNRHNPRGSERR
jgi:hypothetical protein